MGGAAGRPDLLERIEAFLSAHHVMTLATGGAAGPWATPVFYANDRLTLYFVSSAASRHSIELESGGAVAAAVHAECRDWREIRGVQLEGTAARLDGAARAAAAACYGKRFPLVADLASAPAEIAIALARVEWYRVSPRRIRLIDNTLGFGHKEEWVQNVPG